MMYEIRNSAESEDTLDIFIYSSVQRSWWDEDAMDADKFRKAIQEHKNAKNVNLYINSYGGSVNEGVAIYSQIKRLNAHGSHWQRERRKAPENGRSTECKGEGMVEGKG